MVDAAVVDIDGMSMSTQVIVGFKQAYFVLAGEQVCTDKSGDARADNGYAFIVQGSPFFVI